jgi:TnpA family transposase
MPRRTVLTSAQREALLALPHEDADLARHYTLGEGDLGIIRRRRREANRLGFALQLCVLRYPGRLLRRGELIPERIVAFISRQLGIGDDALGVYAVRVATRYLHSSALQDLYGFRPFTGQLRAELTDTLATAAMGMTEGGMLASAMVEEMRRRKIIIPGITVVERLCADILVEAERRALRRLSEGLSRDQVRRLDALCELIPETHRTFLAWLRHPPGGPSPRNFQAIVARLTHLRTIGLPPERVQRIPERRLRQLSREGRRMTAQHLAELAPARRRGLLVAIALELMASLTDDAIDMHDRMVGRLFRKAENRQGEALRDQRALIGRSVRHYATVGAAVIAARRSGADPFAAIETVMPWEAFERSVADAAELGGRHPEDPLDLMETAYPKLRAYTPLLLATFDFRGVAAARPLLEALDLLHELNVSNRRRLPVDPPLGFVRPRWRRFVLREDGVDRRYYELCAMEELRQRLRAGDVWVVGSRRYRSLEDDLLSQASFTELHASGEIRLGVEADVHAFLDRRRQLLDTSLTTVNAMAEQGELSEASIADGELVIRPLRNDTPPEAKALAQRLYALLPRIRITELLDEVDGWTRFSEAFSHLRTGEPPRDRRAVLTAVLADGTNLGLARMAAACSEVTLPRLAWAASWHLSEETYKQALARVVDAQRRMPLAARWGDGAASSSDGQYFRAGGHGEAVSLVNARYGTEPGAMFYTHLSDQFGPFHTKAIAATASEAPHVLDGLLYHDSGLGIDEHSTDTAAATDQVFAACALLGFRFMPRIRDLGERRLYSFALPSTYKALEPLIARRVNAALIVANWDEILRFVASIRLGVVTASHILKRLAAYPQQNALAAALAEVGRIERTLFTLQLLQSGERRHLIQNRLNKGESRNRLARAVFFHRLGEIRDRSFENQAHRASGLNLLVSAIIVWNTRYLGRAVQCLRARGEDVPDELLAHVWPTAWEHVNLTGDYSWRSIHRGEPGQLKPLREKPPIAAY